MIWNNKELNTELSKSKNLYDIGMGYEINPIEAIEYLVSSAKRSIEFQKKNKKNYRASDIRELKRFKKQCEKNFNQKSLGISFGGVYAEKKKANVVIQNINFGEIILETIFNDIDNKIKDIERGKNRIDKEINDIKNSCVNEIEEILKQEGIKKYLFESECLISINID